MRRIKMAMGSDEKCRLTDVVCHHLEQKGIELVLCGVLAGKEDDYVDVAQAVAEKVAAGECDEGILFCGTGAGVALVANKIPGARAALCVDAFSAKIARIGNNANIITLGIRLTGEPLAKEIMDTWLETPRATEPRLLKYHRKIDELDRRYRREINPVKQ